MIKKVDLQITQISEIECDNRWRVSKNAGPTCPPKPIASMGYRLVDAMADQELRE